MDKFFQTFSLAFGYYGGNTKEAQINMYIPAVLTMSYNGYFVYYMNEVGGRLEHTLTPKQFYAEKVGNYNINYTLDDYIILDSNVTLGGKYGIQTENYSNAYRIGEKFRNVYVNYDSRLPGGYGEHIIGDVDGNGKVEYSDLNNVILGLETKIATYEAWNTISADGIRESIIESGSYPEYNDRDNPNYFGFLADWRYDIDQNGYIDEYDKKILNEYLYNKNHPTYATSNKGRIVDTRHFDETDPDSIPHNGWFYKTTPNSDGVIYEKSFYYSGGVRYLLEEWYTEATPNGRDKPNSDETYLYRRMTPYTEEDYAFTLALKNSGAPDWLVKGSPEKGAGFYNPYTEQYEISEFYAHKNKVITEEVMKQMQYYVVQHNKYAQSYGITYNFVLPEIINTDWDNALKDITVIAFVQGIPILGQQYYNNYGLSSANIVNKEFFIRYKQTYRSSSYNTYILFK